MPPEFVFFENDGVKITKTSYWESEASMQGWLYLTWNAGGARLLVPPKMTEDVREMKTATYVIVSREPTSTANNGILELMFEDNSDNPYRVNIASNMYDRELSDDLRRLIFPFHVYTPDGLALETKARYRIVPRLPCRQSWRE